MYFNHILHKQIYPDSCYKQGENLRLGDRCVGIHQLKTSERIMIVVGSDARKVVMEEFSWWHVKGASIRFNRLEICR